MKIVDDLDSMCSTFDSFITAKEDSLLLREYHLIGKRVEILVSKDNYWVLFADSSFTWSKCSYAELTLAPTCKNTNLTIISLKVQNNLQK